MTFHFDASLPAHRAFLDPLREILRQAYAYVGYHSSAIDALTGQLGAALTERAASGRHRCEVRFLARAGELEIVVAAAGRPDWRATWPLPAS